MGAQVDRGVTATMSDDVEGSQFDIGTNPIRLVRVGNVVQAVFSGALEARLLYQDLSENHERKEHALRL